MKKLLAFCITSKLSGGEKYLIQLLESLAQRGWEPVLVGSGNPALELETARSGLAYVDSKLGPKLGRSTALTVVRTWHEQRQEFQGIVNEMNPDAVLLQYKLEQLLWGGSDSQRPYVMLEHGPIPKAICNTPVIRARYARSLRKAAVRFGASRPALDSMAVMGQSGLFLGAGIDELRRSSALDSSSERGHYLKSLVGERTKIGVYAGRLAPNKGVLEAAQFISGMEDVGLVIAGSGPLEGSLKNLAAQNSNIAFIGQVDDVLQYVAGADFGILLTDDPGEGRPLFAIECASVGVPLIALKGSAAILSVSEELPPEAVYVIDERSAASVEAAISLINKFEPVQFTWAESARVFDEQLIRFTG